MILILSSAADQSTNAVIDWLDHLKKPWVRINETTPLRIELELGHREPAFSLHFDNRTVHLSDITSYWYRRGNFKFQWQFPKGLDEFPMKSQLLYFLKNEIETLQQFLHYLLRHKKGIGDYQRASPNKLITLITAQAVGLTIPETRITNNPNYPLERNWISKAIWEALYLHESSVGSIKTYTERVYRNGTCTTSFPSLFQTALKKQFELRIFFLNKTCHAMAIFSQYDERTSTDYRNYNLASPNRRVPFDVPTELEKKIIAFMKKMQLKSGSLDFIVTPAGQYVFLEVNPVGQFGMSSRPCNFPLEESIARYL